MRRTLCHCERSSYRATDQRRAGFHSATCKRTRLGIGNSERSCQDRRNGKNSRPRLLPYDRTIGASPQRLRPRRWFLSHPECNRGCQSAEPASPRQRRPLLVVVRRDSLRALESDSRGRAASRTGRTLPLRSPLQPRNRETSGRTHLPVCRGHQHRPGCSRRLIVLPREAQPSIVLSESDSYGTHLFGFQTRSDRDRGSLVPTTEPRQS